jgi:hypothetical protein
MLKIHRVTTIIRGSPEAIAAIRKCFSSRDGKEEFVNFAKVIPTPTDVYLGDLPFSLEMVKVAETVAQKAAVATIAKLHSKAANVSAGQDEIQSALGAILKIAATHDFDLDAMLLSVRTWHDWNVEAWGTRWNSFSCSFTEDSIRFDTAGATPAPVIAEISRQLGDGVVLKVEYADEDIGYNCGAYEICGGEIGPKLDLEKGSEQAIRFACMIKGADPSEYLQDDDYDM